MKVFVAGATGTLGTVLVPQLIADVMHGPALLAALDGHTVDAVIHQATAINRTPMAHRDLEATNAPRTRGAWGIQQTLSRTHLTKGYLHE